MDSRLRFQLRHNDSLVRGSHSANRKSISGWTIQNQSSRSIVNIKSILEHSIQVRVRESMSLFRGRGKEEERVRMCHAHGNFRFCYLMLLAVECCHL